MDPLLRKVVSTLEYLHQALIHAKDYEHASLILEILLARCEALYGTLSIQCALALGFLARTKQRFAQVVGTKDQDNVATKTNLLSTAKSSIYWSTRSVQVMTLVYGPDHKMTQLARQTLDLARTHLETIARKVRRNQCVQVRNPCAPVPTVHT